MQVIIGWPQFIMIFLLVLEIVVWSVKHGTPREPYNVYAKLTDQFVFVGLMLWGGFFSGTQ